jgi:predicted nucleotidyltransferase
MIEINKENIIAFLKANKSTLNDKFGVISIGLMGSFARDEQTEDSDIDFIVDFNEISYSKLAGLAIYLETEFGKKVDIIRKRDNMRRSLLDRSKKEAIYA